MFEDSPRDAIDPELLRVRIDEFQREKATTADQRKEIAVLIKQAAGEIERLAQRNRDISHQVRVMESNLEARPRSEIRQLYAQSQEAQMRLFMMQGQLEQLRYRQSSLEKAEQIVDRVLEVSGSLEALYTRRGSEIERQVPGPSTPEVNGAAVVALQSAELAQYRLSRQLQDVTAQALSDLILRAEVSERLVGVDPQMASEEMAALRRAATSALRTTRQLVYELQPPLLEELGLIAALRRYLETSRVAEMLHVDLEVAGQERRLPRAVELALYRIVQEALSNAAQHSGARRAEVRLRFEAGQVVATITDEGRGFDVEPASVEPSPGQPSGLADMQLRTRLVGGSLEFSSKPGAGCMISVAIPA